MALDTTNPFTNLEGTECGPGQVPYNVIRGGRLGREVIASGCVDYYIAQPYLNDDNIATIPEDIFNSVDLLSPDTIKKALEWNALKEAYENGEATLRDLQNFDPGVLSDNETWMGQYNDYVTQESILGEGTTDEQLRDILRRNGYDDETIDEILAAGVDNDRFKGNNVLSNALCEIGTATVVTGVLTLFEKMEPRVQEQMGLLRGSTLTESV